MNPAALAQKALALPFWKALRFGHELGAISFGGRALELFKAEPCATDSATFGGHGGGHGGSVRRDRAGLA